ncbi:MAG: tetratricopeptide repeat protein [Bacteroidetes bacterium]|nr:tetratricopeptide repeat protein [Bacteroidota bacterium]
MPVLGAFLLLASAQAQSDVSLTLEAKKLAESGSLNGSLGDIKTAHRMLRKAIEGDSDLAEAHYYLGYAQYQRAIFLVNETEQGQNMLTNQDSTLTFLDESIQNLTKSIKISKKSEITAEAHALLSMAYGQKIRIRPRKGMVLGLRSRRNIQKAKTLNANNPRVVLAEAMYRYHTPAPYGGSQEGGLAGFRRAADLFSSAEEDSPLLPSWGEVEAYTWLGIACMGADQYEQARHAFEKVLEINPDYGWVKYSLLPMLQERESRSHQSKFP